MRQLQIRTSLKRIKAVPGSSTVLPVINLIRLNNIDNTSYNIRVLKYVVVAQNSYFKYTKYYKQHIFLLIIKLIYRE